MRIMGLDVGEKTIGVAISDPLGYTAQGIKTIIRGKFANDIKQIKDLIIKYEVNEIVVGLPKNMNGTEGEKVNEIKNFIKKLQKEINLGIKELDERLTTMEGEKLLIEGDVSRKRRKKIIDKLAACLILQGYLDRQKDD